MIDSHCHLADDAFVEDLEPVIARARGAGVSAGLCVLSMGEPAERERADRVSALWPETAFAIGVHPHEAGAFAASIAELPDRVRSALEAIPRARAVGEIGLDYHYDLSPRDVQRDIFASQVALAGEMQLPVVVHTREAEADTVAVLERASATRVAGVLHCFTGTRDLARWALAAGFYISFAGIVTFANADALRAVAREVPLERMLVETDCPYLSPVPFRGARNEPAHVVEVAAAIARLKSLTIEQLDDAVTANFRTLFGV